MYFSFTPVGIICVLIGIVVLIPFKSDVSG